MIPLVGAPQHYAWGSPTAIPTAIGVAPDGRPWAELWWGTHPDGPTMAHVDGDDVPLAELVELPFLVKVLAAAQPLSLQAHPSEEQAVIGYGDEERRGVPLDSPERRYKDPHGKPEMLIAVTPFEVLSGFRDVDDAAAELDRIGGSEVADRLRSDGPAATVGWLLHHRPALALDHPLFRRLHDAYPGDPGAIVALLLQSFRLRPGQAVSLTAGVLHSYLGGVGLEVMAPSDNVLRGGLTPKPVDVDELLHVLDPSAPRTQVLQPGADGWYETAGQPFAVQALGPTVRWVADGPEIMVRLAGDGGTEAWYVRDGDDAQWPGSGLGIRVTSRRPGA